jgi:hypothetical protein
VASLGSTPSLIVAAGVGAAAATALEPAFEVPGQEAWKRNPNRVLDPGTLARLVARGGVLLGSPDGSTDGSAYDEALRQGYTSDKLDRLVYLSQTFPGSGELDSLSNRRLISQAMVKEALTRSGLPPEWHEPLIKLFSDILSPGELAAAVHRGLVPDAGLLLGEQPEPPFKVEAYPVQDIDAINEAAGSGFDEKRLQVLVGLQGLPMGPHEAAQALFRQIITHGDYIRAFNTSNMRNEWAQAILEQTRQIPTARDFFENALRGYHNLAWAQKEAERHGMSPEDSLVIYQNQGRPMNVHAITQALARGGVFKPEPGELKDPYDAAIVEGNLKPAYYDLAKANRYTLPSPFVMRSLAASGVWTEAKTAERLKWLGWYPADADEAAKAWTSPAGGGADADPRERLAVSQAVASLKKQFMIERVTSQEAIDGMVLLGLSQATAGRIVETWTVERGWTEKPLTAAQIKKAYSAADIPLDDALDRLVRLRYTVADAQLYLTT